MTDHSVNMINRKSIDLSGVNNVVNFDDEEIILDTMMGCLEIGGEELHITMLNLDNGKVSIHGNISHLAYKAQGADFKARGKTILNRLFK
ncbi:Sporulation protein YabP [Syntrophomonas zehnderi OL-4]|uniref:Sporulation protein YabP n=1 Tax=Syntrophomonas zehnderi OL-4 TaxID=690567 RepID=A0A0E4C7Q7_9FIRM|nr:sporulation protein YabP [Syntrophomonas zehnderi]CFX10537.1 Sporulation protein YabP [Syntrophomonas zehnderi OL-4]